MAGYHTFVLYVAPKEKQEEFRGLGTRSWRVAIKDYEAEDHLGSKGPVITAAAAQKRIRLAPDETPLDYIKWLREKTPNMKFEFIRTDESDIVLVNLLFTRKDDVFLHQMRWMGEAVAEAA